MMNRFRRQFIDILNTKTIFRPNLAASNSQVYMVLGDEAMRKMEQSPGQTGREVIGQVMKGSGELVLTPITWIKKMQTNWPIYLICGTIICLVGLYLYCAISNRLRRSRNSSEILTGLASAISHKDRSSTRQSSRKEDHGDREKY